MVRLPRTRPVLPLETPEYVHDVRSWQLCEMRLRLWSIQAPARRGVSSSHVAGMAE